SVACSRWTPAIGDRWWSGARPRTPLASPVRAGTYRGAGMADAKTYAGLDIGTTKITAVVAEPDGSGEGIRILGLGTAPSGGVKGGIVVHLERTIRSIQHAVQEAERMSGRTIRSVSVGIAGDHVRGLLSRGVIAVSRKDAEIRLHDVERVIEAAKAVAIPADR